MHHVDGDLPSEGLVDVDARGGGTEPTALWSAALRGKTEAVRCLLGAGADVGVRNRDGERLLAAVERRRRGGDVVELLRSAEVRQRRLPAVPP